MNLITKIRFKCGENFWIVRLYDWLTKGHM